MRKGAVKYASKVVSLSPKFTSPPLKPSKNIGSVLGATSISIVSLGGIIVTLNNVDVTL